MDWSERVDSKNENQTSLANTGAEKSTFFCFCNFLYFLIGLFLTEYERYGKYYCFEVSVVVLCIFSIITFYINMQWFSQKN